MSPLRKFATWIGVARATFAFKRGRLSLRFRRELELEREVAELRRENEKLRARLFLATGGFDG